MRMLASMVLAGAIGSVGDRQTPADCRPVVIED